MIKKLNGLSLFSSAGIGEVFLKHTIDMKVANELLPNRCKLYKHFHPDVDIICGDIRNSDIYDSIIEKSKDNKVNFIYATPPCQSFSKAGSQKLGDERDILFKYILSIILSIKPLYILIENVPEFITSDILFNGHRTKVLDIINRELSDLYNINTSILDSSDFGVPQKRKRSIILMSLKSSPVWNFPKPTHIIKKTVRETISHLPSLESGENSNVHPLHKAKVHNDRHILWISHTSSGKSAFENDVYYPKKNGRRIKGFKTTYKRIGWDKPAPTITMANGSISSQNNCHPGYLCKNGLYNNARVLTIYELMLLTSLDDNWIPPEWASDTLLRHVLGECVPPLLIKHLVNELFKPSVETKNIDKPSLETKNIDKTLSIIELKQMCKNLGIKRYSKLKKYDLITLLNTYEKNLDILTTKGLKLLCKRKHISIRKNLSKKELIAILNH